MTEELAYQIKLDVYEGPFDLLLRAIDEGKIDVHHVSLAQITLSYYEYWKAEEPDLLLAADFLYMAAYLIELKSRRLLPVREEIFIEEDIVQVEESLVRHLQEYERYKAVAQELKQRKEVFRRIYSRHEGERLDSDIELVDVNLRDLVLAFRRVYNEAIEREKIVPIQAEEITLEGRIIEIRQMLEGRNEGVSFENLFIRRTRLEIVVTFLAILELAKQKCLMIKQDQRFGTILIFSVPETQIIVEISNGSKPG